MVAGCTGSTGDPIKTDTSGETDTTARACRRGAARTER